MATKNARAKLNDDVKWVSCTLDTKQTADMKRNLPDWLTVMTKVQDMVDSGYKFTVAIDKYNKCYSAYFFPVGESHANVGAILTSRGNSVFSALRGGVYRHYGIYNEVWSAWSKEVIDEE